MLKLKSPSRLAKETFLLALGIAKYEGNIAHLDSCSTLFPDFHHFLPITRDLPIIDLAESNDDMADTVASNTEEPPSLSLSIFDRGTPVNSKMMAIESELEQDMVHMRDRLETKNKIVSELHHELNCLRNDYNGSKVEHGECKKNLRLSEKRIE